MLMEEPKTFYILRQRNPMFAEIIKMMFEHIGLEITDEYVFDAFWFTEHSWSDEEEELFKQKIVDYLSSQKLIDVRIMADNFFITKKKFRKIADEICWNWGWKSSSRQQGS